MEHKVFRFGVMILIAIPLMGISPLLGSGQGLEPVGNAIRVQKENISWERVPLEIKRLTPEDWYRAHPEDKNKSFSAPWSDDAQTPPWTQAEFYTSMAVDALGRIYISYSIDYGSNTYPWGLKTSTDFGTSWDDRAWWLGSGYGLQSPNIAITDDGKHYIFGSLTGGTYDYNPAFCRSAAGSYNDPDASEGVSYFSIPQCYYPEVVTYGNGNQFVAITYTRETTGNDTVLVLFSHDSLTNTTGITFDNSSELGYTSIGVNVVGLDTILVHGFDELGVDWNVYCYLDTLNGSGTLYGWSTTNANNDQYPRIFFDQSYAYIAYQGDVGSGNNDIMFNYSTDNGATWASIADITNDAANETYCRLSGDADKIGCVYIYGGNRLRFLYSYDNGQTWSSYEQVNDAAANNVSNEYSSASLLYTPGRWYASWTDGRDGNNNIYASYRDMGQGSITHSPAELLFDYTSKAAGPPPERIISFLPQIKVDPKLVEQVNKVGKDGFVPTIILLSSRVNPDWLNYYVRPMERKKRREFASHELMKFQRESQSSILSFLNNEKANGNVKEIKSFWIISGLYAEVKPEVIEKLKTRSDVGQLCPDEEVQLADSRADPYHEISNWHPQTDEICWGVAKINAPAVWGLGYTGAGIVVGHMDSGCDYTHPDFTDHLWNGNPHGLPNHGWDYVTPDNDPMDTDGHGTNTAGIIAGDGTSGSQTGVAPDAELIYQKLYPNGTTSMFNQACQDAVSWGADLLSTSLGWSNPSEGTKNTLRQQSEYLYSNGLIWSCAAGNGNGVGGHYPVPNDIIAPACAPPPKPLNGTGGVSAAIALGATSSADNIASWSSYGPTEWDNASYPNEYPYPPGLLKPDLAAPGVNCKSTRWGGGYDNGINGTSFAQPHFAGMVALMLDREPNLNPDAIDSIAKMTAIDIETPGDDSLSGRGRIDALAAVNAISEGLKQGSFWVINQASATGLLEVDSITKAQDKNWLVYVNPTEFTVPIDDSNAVTVQTDTTGMGCVQGANWDTLLVWSNSATYAVPERVPVQLLYPSIGVEEEISAKVRDGQFSGITYPNPLKGFATVELSIPVATRLRLAIFDGAGRKVKSLLDRKMEAGNYLIRWKGDDDRGKPLPAGVYFLTLDDETEIKTQKLVIVR